MVQFFSLCLPSRKAGGLQIPCCQGIAVADYSFTLDALALKPSSFCNVGVISDEKMREPTSYRDTFMVLTENKILKPDDLSRFENIASFRNLLVHYYEKVDDAIVYGIFRNNLSDFDLFVDRIVHFLGKRE